MVQNSNKVLGYKHIKQPTKEIVSYIDNRRKGIVKSLKTRWPKFNRHCMGGIEPNVIITIAGISGSGKSSFANSLETDLFDMNPDEDFVVLSFSFEIRKMSRNSVNCLGSPEEGNQQPSLGGDTFEGSTTSSESQVDNNSTTKAECPNYKIVPMNIKELKEFYKDKDIV